MTILICVSIHTDWFSWSSNALSDLGALGTSYSWVYNGGMILAGIFGALYGLGLLDYFKNTFSQIGAIIFVFGMGSLALVGFYPSGTDPHVTVSWMFFGLTALGILTIGCGETQEGNELGFVIVLMVFSLLPAAYWASVTFSGAAIPEIIGALGFEFFALTYSFKILT